MAIRTATRDTAPLVDSLLDALAAGRPVEEGFRELFGLYYRPVRDFFARRGFSPADCQDLTQETFLGIFRGMGSFRRGAPFDAWLFAIAANVYRKRLRHQATGSRRGQEVPLDATATGAADGEPGVELAAETEAADGGTLARERSRLLRRAVEALPPQMQACLVLRVYHDLKYREVASRLALSIDTVKAHLFQARQRLKGELGEYFLPEGGEEEA